MWLFHSKDKYHGGISYEHGVRLADSYSYSFFNILKSNVILKIC